MSKDTIKSKNIPSQRNFIQKLRIKLWKKFVNFYPWYLRKFYHINIGKDTKISWKANLDVNINPQGLHIGNKVKITGWVIILTHDGGRKLKLNTYIEDMVFIAVRAIILPGIRIGRGATIGAGSVVASNIPPYAIVMGNPAKVIGFKMKPDEILEFEKSNYPLEERLSREQLEKNYKKYYIDRIKFILENQK